jgi:hypothetical protein
MNCFKFIEALAVKHEIEVESAWGEGHLRCCLLVGGVCWAGQAL